jgi:DNA-nicking Smr family endonuclease
MADRPRRDDQADADEFSRAMRGVTPLRRDARGRVRSRPTPPAPATRSEDRREDVPEPRADGFAAPGIDRRELRRLRRGEYPPAARLDLHGETAADAVARAERFLAASRHRRFRCVCIVHGRGLHSEAGAAVLKTRVREHLRTSPHVLAWADAPRHDGGPGAVYVLLRR